MHSREVLHILPGYLYCFPEMKTNVYTHLVRVIAMTVSEVRRTPAAHLVSDVVLGGYEKCKDCEHEDRVHTVETVTERVARPRISDVNNST